MSQLFHKSCYNTRNSRCRSLSTNTDLNKRDPDEDKYDSKIEEIKLQVAERVDTEINRAQKSRESIIDKFNKIDSKIDTMLEIQGKVMALRKDLQTAESSLSELAARIARIEVLSSSNDGLSQLSKKISVRSKEPNFEELEMFSTNLKHS